MYFKYLKYVLKHKWYVFQECCKLGIPFRGLVHDLSKFKPIEFIAYARFFNGDYPEALTVYEKTYHWKMPTKKSVKMDFDLAWLYHQRVNKHHWQWWILKEDEGKIKVLEMPYKYRKEMLADWRGAGKAINGFDETKEWYLKNKDTMILAQYTREWIEEQLL